MRIYFATGLALASAGMILMVIFLDAPPETASRPFSGSGARGQNAEALPGNTAGSEPTAGANSRRDLPAPSLALGGQLGAESAPKTADEILATVREASSSTQGKTTNSEPLIDNRQRDQDFIRAVTVEVQNHSSNAVGSGVVIAAGARMVDVLTADHVLDAPNSDKQPLELAVRWKSRDVDQGDSIIGLASLSRPLYQAVRILKRDRTSDLAVIRVEMPGGTETVQAASLHPGGIDSLMSLVGESAWTIASNSEGNAHPTPSVSLAKIEGMEVARASESAAANTYLKVNAPSELGMSGGGLFLPSTSNQPPRLIGIASGNSNRSGYYVAAHKIEDLMRKIRASGIQ